MKQPCILGANENWIIDRFRSEYFSHIKNKNLESDPKQLSSISFEERPYVWFIADFVLDQLQNWQINQLQKLPVLVSCHHFVPEKITESEIRKYKTIDSFTTLFHVPCENTKKQLIEFFDVLPDKIRVHPFWVNNNIFYPIEDKMRLREELNLPKNKFLVFSAVRDTEGSGIERGIYSPKKEKGSHYFVEIIRDMKSTYDVEVVLGGWRRQYVKQEFDKYGIKYHSRDSKTVNDIMSFEDLNRYYNACDLVINPAIVEGGPMSVPEAAATKTPIISTNTGIASVILHPDSIYEDPECPDWERALQNSQKEEVIEYNYKKVSELFIYPDNKGFEYFDNLFKELMK